MMVWAHHTSAAGAECAAECASYVDDRFFWARDDASLDLALAASERFDTAFDFSCDRSKCQVAVRSTSHVGPRVVARLGYDLYSKFEVLGVSFDMDSVSA